MRAQNCQSQQDQLKKQPQNQFQKQMHTQHQIFSSRPKAKPFSVIVVRANVAECAGRSDLKERVQNLCKRLARKGSVSWVNDETILMALPGTSATFAEWAAHQIEDRGTDVLRGRGRVLASSVQASPKDTFRDILKRGVFVTATCPRAA